MEKKIYIYMYTNKKRKTREEKKEDRGQDRNRNQILKFHSLIDKRLYATLNVKKEKKSATQISPRMRR